MLQTTVLFVGLPAMIQIPMAFLSMAGFALYAMAAGLGAI